MATALSLDFTAPDAELFQTRFPAFVGVDEDRIGFLLVECAEHVDTRWRAGDYQMAIMYLAAHLLTLEGEPAASAVAAGNGAAALAGNVSEVQVGDVRLKTNGGVTPSISADLSGGLDDLGLTHFGRMFQRLRRKNFGGPAVFS